MCCVLAVACGGDDSSNPATCDGKSKGTYVLTPTMPAPGSTYQLSADYVFYDRETDGGGASHCDLVIYDACPARDQNYFQYQVGAGCALPAFNAGLDTSDYRYDFNGDAIRLYNTGSGPFATGVYDRDDGQQGSFEFYEEGRTP